MSDVTISIISILRCFNIPPGPLERPSIPTVYPKEGFIFLRWYIPWVSSKSYVGNHHSPTNQNGSTLIVPQLQ